MLIVGFQSCAATVGGNLGRDESTIAAGAMGLFVVFLFLIAEAFAISYPLVSLVTFLIAGTIAMAAGLYSDFADLAIWGSVALGLTVMSYFGQKEKQRRRSEQQQRVR